MPRALGERQLEMVCGGQLDSDPRSTTETAFQHPRCAVRFSGNESRAVQILGVTRW